MNDLGPVSVRFWENVIDSVLVARTVGELVKVGVGGGVTVAVYVVVCDVVSVKDGRMDTVVD